MCDLLAGELLLLISRPRRSEDDAACHIPCTGVILQHSGTQVGTMIDSTVDEESNEDISMNNCDPF